MPLAIVLAAAAVAHTAACRRDTASGPAAARMNLVLITVDTLRADRVGPYGGAPAIAPTLTALARRGVTFLDATAHAPLTLPSHASILTGRYPPAHGVRDNGGFPLPETIVTLAERLRDAGYHTSAFVSSFVLARPSGLAQGFELYVDRFDTRRAHVTLSALERPGPEVAAEAAQWIARAPEPFFLWVHVYDPHAPYEAPPAFRSRFPDSPYDAEVATSDWAVGQVLDAIPAAARDRTFVVATADHGEGLGEHGEAEHGIFLYEATLRVPLIMAGAGLPAGRTVREQVRHVDILPTVLELLRVPAASPCDGVSLAGLAKGGRRREAPPSFAESLYGSLHFGWSELRAVRDGEWKYIDAPERELYDLRADPGERTNVYAKKPELAAGLDRSLAALAGPASAPAAQPAVDAATAERLRSLGYLSGPAESRSGGGAPKKEDAAARDPKRRIGEYRAYVTAFNEALATLESGDPVRAEAGFRRLARAFPMSFEAHQYLGRALAGQGRHEAALGEFDLAIRLGSRSGSACFDAARSLAALRRFDAALGRVGDGLVREPNSFYGYLVEGIVAAAAGQDARAQAALERALALNPGMAAAEFEVGRLAERRGDRAEAEARYRTAIAADPELAAARDGLRRLERR